MHAVGSKKCIDIEKCLCNMDFDDKLET